MSARTVKGMTKHSGRNGKDGAGGEMIKGRAGKTGQAWEGSFNSVEMQ